MEQNKPLVSEFAIASLVMGITSFIHIMGMEKAIIAIVFGALALKRIKRTSSMQGAQLARVGLILGIVSIIATIVVMSLLIPKLKQISERKQTTYQQSIQ